MTFVTTNSSSSASASSSSYRPSMSPLLICIRALFIVLFLFALLQLSAASDPFTDLRSSISNASNFNPVNSSSSESVNQIPSPAPDSNLTDSMAGDVGAREFSVAGGLSRAAWFLIVIICGPILYCCCFVWALWNMITPSDYGTGGGGAGFFQPATSVGGGGMGSGAGGWGVGGNQMMGMGKQQPGCNIG